MNKQSFPSAGRPVWIFLGIALFALLAAGWMNTYDGAARATGDEPPDSVSSERQSATRGAQGSPQERGGAGTEAGMQDAPSPRGIPSSRPRALKTQEEDRDVSANVGRSLTNVIELLNAEKYDEATIALDSLLTAEAMTKMTPFEISRLYQLSFSLNMQKKNYEAAQADLQAAIESGGLNNQEMTQMQYQRGQLFVQMEDYVRAADSLEYWIAQGDATQNQGAYYLLAASYYYQDKFDDARDHMETLFTLPGAKQEGWYSMMASLYLQNEDYSKAKPVLEKMVELYDKETYRDQLNAVNAQLNAAR
jgi:tetratricopeptide (TPR) repeat protein